MRIIKRLFLLLLFPFSLANAQYISGTETIPFTCPSVCQGGKLVLKVYQIENFPAGTAIQAVLSNPSGTFSGGTTIIPSTRYSFNNGSSWINGAFSFSSNVNNLWFEITIPNTQTLSNIYTIKMRASTGYISNDVFNCPGGGKIIVTPGYNPLTAITSNTYGNQQWMAHAFTWSPTTSQLLLTLALIAQQDFFNQANYKGHFVKNALSFDLNFTQQGGMMPGPINTIHDGTSFACGEGYATNFALRFMRTESFLPGRYAFSIAGDDGIRLSIDGGVTWILDSFIEQSYSQSFKSTAQQYPDGICLSGAVNLVIEYFQRPVDMRVTFSSTLVSPIEADPADVSLCAGDSSLFNITAYSGAAYQWQISTDNGITYTALSDVPPYFNTATNEMLIYPSGSDLNGAWVQCVLSNVCPDALYSTSANLIVHPDATLGTVPDAIYLCNEQPIELAFGVTHADSVLWYYSIEQGDFNRLQDGTFLLSDSAATWQYASTENLTRPWQVYMEVSGCGRQFIQSDTVPIFPVHSADDGFVPNVFTPNGDGMNDIFKPILQVEQLMLFTIYNRWGNEVFRFNEALDFWDGTSKGMAAPAGIYFFVFEGVDPCSNKAISNSGSFHLIR